MWAPIPCACTSVRLTELLYLPAAAPRFADGRARAARRHRRCGVPGRQLFVRQLREGCLQDLDITLLSEERTASPHLAHLKSNSMWIWKASWCWESCSIGILPDLKLWMSLVGSHTCICHSMTSDQMCMFSGYLA